jgi:hypothetical protein
MPLAFALDETGMASREGVHCLQIVRVGRTEAPEEKAMLTESLDRPPLRNIGLQGGLNFLVRPMAGPLQCGHGSTAATRLARLKLRRQPKHAEGW